MSSYLYKGWIRHRRFGSRPNTFRYGLFLSYLDLAELPALFDRYWLWSARRPALAWFRRADYLGDPALPLDEAVRSLVFERTGNRPRGPIRLLTHLRFFGWCSNPVSFYYCFDQVGNVETIVAEITNTPWKERHTYVLAVAGADRAGTKVWRWQFEKAFHVSPFLPMDMQYDWRFSPPETTLDVHMQNARAGEIVFDATLHLARQEITRRVLARALAAFPFITLKVSAMIYWQALRLWIKGNRFFPHPRATAPRLPARRTVGP